MTSLYDQTSSLLYQIDGFISAADAFNFGFYKISLLFVSVDIARYSELMNEYLMTYNSTYKVKRQRAADYIFQATIQIQDLSHEMEIAPNSFANLYEAQWFYASFLSLLDKCMSTIKLANSYLIQVRSDEINIQEAYSPNRFYRHDHDTKACHGMYFNVLQLFAKTIPWLRYSFQKISQWLQENQTNITLINAYKLYNDSSGNTDAEDNASKWPNLWTLLKCNECSFENEVLNFSSWKNIVGDLTTGLGDIVATCLLEYERSLQIAYNTSQQPLSTSPTWLLGDILSIYVNDLKLNIQTLDTLLHSYVTGTITLQETITDIDNIVKIMSENVANIEDKFLSSAATWQNDVRKWQGELNSLYTSIISDVILLHQFMPFNANLSAFGRSLSVWYIDKVLLNVIYFFYIPLVYEPSLRSLFSQNLTEFLVTNSSEVMNRTLSRTVANNIQYSKMSCETIETIDNDWKGYTDEVQQTTSSYKSYFLVDQTFIQ